MAGPKYEVGIEFNATGTLEKTIAAMNAQMDSLAAHAKAVNAAVKNITNTKSRANTKSHASNPNKTDVREEKRKISVNTYRQVKQAEAAAKQQVYTAKVGVAQAVERAQQQVSAAKVGVAQAAEREKNGKADEAIAAAKARTQYVLNRVNQQNEKREAWREDKEKVKERRLQNEKLRGLKRIESTAKKAASEVGRVTGGVGKGILSNTVGMFFTPVTAGLALVAAGVIAAKDGIEKYDAALMKLETTGQNVGASQKELARIIGSKNNLGVSTLAGMQQHLATLFPGSDVTKGALGSTAISGVNFLQNIGYDQNAASGIVGDQVDALNKLYATVGDPGKRQGMIARALSTEMSYVAGLGSKGGDYMAAVNSVFGSIGTDAYARQFMGSAGMGKTMSNIANMVRGGMDPDSIKALYSMTQGGIHGNLIAQMVRGNNQLQMTGIPGAIGGNAIMLNTPMQKALGADPTAFLNQYVLKGLSAAHGKTLDKLSDSERQAVMAQAQQDYGSLGGQGKAIVALLQSAMQNVGQVQQNAKWAKMQNDYVEASMNLHRSLDNFVLAIGNSGIVTAMNALAGAINSVSGWWTMSRNIPNLDAIDMRRRFPDKPTPLEPVHPNRTGRGEIPDAHHVKVTILNNSGHNLNATAAVSRSVNAAGSHIPYPLTR